MFVLYIPLRVYSANANCSKDIIEYLRTAIIRSPDDGEGVSPYYGMGANWMFDGSWVDRAR